MRLVKVEVMQRIPQILTEYPLKLSLRLKVGVYIK